MGTWVAHLRIAEKLLSEIPGLDAGLFACGSLAPDSGLPNADWTAFDPPKEVTHFGQDEGSIRDLEFYRKYMVAPDDEKYSFLLGYFFHLVCDNLWAIRIGETSKNAYRFLFEEHGSEAWWMIKKDWYGLDFKYLQQKPNIWQIFVNAPNPPQYLPYLLEHVLNQQLDYIRKFYSQPPENLDRDYLYLNEATMKRYVDESAALLLRIYHLLQKSIPDSHDTALRLLPDFEFVGYKPPLGDLDFNPSSPVMLCPYDPNG